MQALQANRKANRMAATRDLGVPPNHERTWQGQVRALGIEADILMLPLLVNTDSPLQDENGDPLFVWGLSSFGDPTGDVFG